MMDVAYVGRHFNVAFPTGGGGIQLATMSIAALDANGTPTEQPRVLPCLNSRWDDKTRRLEAVCGDASVNVALQVLPVGIGGVIIAEATCATPGVK